MTLSAVETEALVARAVGGDRRALEDVVRAIQDDVYNLAMRMLGVRADAEDATQEICIQVVTHLAQWRGEASFRTWVWRIATRHVLARKKNAVEEMTSFEAIEGMIQLGNANPALPALTEAELSVLETELRIACTEGMIQSLDRDHRVAWILAEIFDMSSDDGAAALDIEPAAFRKRVSRARERLGEWMQGHCGIVNPSAPCRCRRQIPVALEVGAISASDLQFAGHPERSPATLGKRHLGTIADQLDRAAAVLCMHPDYAAPEALLAKVKDVLSTRTVALLD